AAASSSRSSEPIDGWRTACESGTGAPGAGATDSRTELLVLVYLNGEFILHAEARIPVDDRGFLFADGVYEVVRVYEGRAYLLDAHLRRLRQGLRALRIDESAIEELAPAAERLL